MSFLGRQCRQLITAKKQFTSPRDIAKNAQAAIDRDIHRAVNLGEMFEYETQDYLDAVATSTMLTPVVGDLAGIAADVNMYATEPESRNGLITFLLRQGFTFCPGSVSGKEGAQNRKKTA